MELVLGVKFAMRFRYALSLVCIVSGKDHRQVQILPEIWRFVEERFGRVIALIEEQA